MHGLLTGGAVAVAVVVRGEEDLDAARHRALPEVPPTTPQRTPTRHDTSKVFNSSDQQPASC